MNQSHDGFPGAAAVERSLHLEEYSRSRPASAGSRPRSLLNKVANAAAAAQVDDDPEPADAEPWVLEGWGDGPSVSEAAQQAALRLAPHLKNVPTTLVGLGGAGGRRVLSAGHQGRSPLKASEARRKPGSGPPILQTDRRAAAAVRRAPPPRDLDVGDESDVEPAPAPAARASPAMAGPSGSHASAYGSGSPGQGRTGPAQRASPSPARQPGPSLSQQQNPAGVSTRLGRREAPALPTGQIAAQQPSGAAMRQPSPRSMRQPSPRSPHHRGPSTDGFPAGSQSMSPAAAATGAAARCAPGMPRAPPAPVGSGVPLSHAPHPTPYGHPPLPPHGHLDPICAVGSHDGLPRGGNDAAGGPADARYGRGNSSHFGGDAGEVRRSSSFSSSATSPAHQTRGEHLAPPGTCRAEPSSPHTLNQGAAQRLSSPSGQGQGHHPPPPLPGLAGCRRTNSRGETGLSGWDPDAPAVPSIQSHSPGQAPPLSLWVGPSGSAAGTAGLHVSTGLPSGRAAPQPAGGQQRREQLGGNSRLQRGGGVAPAAAAAAGALDLSLVPDRTSAGRLPPGGTPLPLQVAAGRAMSPEVSGVSSPMGAGLPQQDSLAEFCASRGEMGSAGAAPGGGGGSGRVCGPAGLETRVQSQRGASLNGLLPTASGPELGPMRVTSLTKATTAVGRVS